MSDAEVRRWMARATSQFARTVYTELKRAGHGKADILKFINELMDQLSKDTGEAPVEPPQLIDPERGLPDRDTIFDILEFEIGRWQQDRRTGRLAVLVCDLALPAVTAGAAHRRAHEAFVAALRRQLRRGDSIGHLGTDRYLVVAPFGKDGVVGALVGRLQTTMNELAPELPDGATLVVRGAECAATDGDAQAVVTRCFEQAATTIVPVRSEAEARTPRPVARKPGRVEDIVLALGGGAARAASHAGVFHELAASQVRVAGVAGCSAGGLVGAMFARGMSPDTIVQRFLHFSATDTYRDMRRTYATFVREARNAILRSRSRYFGGTSMAFHSETALSAVSTDLLLRFVEYFVGPDCDIQSLSMPFSVVATDLVEGRASLLSHGSLHRALAATCALPGLFPPQPIGERLLVDGSAVSEVPVFAAELLGIHAPVLAVHLDRPWSRVTDYQCSTEVATRSNALAHAELVREQLRHTQFLLSIRVDEVGWLDFRHAPRLQDLGRAAAREALPQLLERMARAR